MTENTRDTLVRLITRFLDFAEWLKGLPVHTGETSCKNSCEISCESFRPPTLDLDSTAQEVDEVVAWAKAHRMESIAEGLTEAFGELLSCTSTARQPEVSVILDAVDNLRKLGEQLLERAGVVEKVVRKVAGETALADGSPFARIMAQEDRNVTFRELAKTICKSERVIRDWRDNGIVKRAYPDLARRTDAKKARRGASIDLHRAVRAFNKAGYLK